MLWTSDTMNHFSAKTLQLQILRTFLITNNANQMQLNESPFHVLRMVSYWSHTFLLLIDHFLQSVLFDTFLSMISNNVWQYPDSRIFLGNSSHFHAIFSFYLIYSSLHGFPILPDLSHLHDFPIIIKFPHFYMILPIFSWIVFTSCINVCIVNLWITAHKQTHEIIQGFYRV